MEVKQINKFLKDDTYVHCSICGNFGNMNSFAHRKSENHQKKLALKLRKTAFHLSQKLKIPIVIHDEEWKGRDAKNFCHFCNESYKVHGIEDEFVVEHLGSLFHHNDSHHIEAVEAFLENNFCKKDSKKYYVQKSDLDSFLQKLPEAKAKYLKKMDMLNDISVNQIKSAEEERKKLIAGMLQEHSSSYQELDSSSNAHNKGNGSINTVQSFGKLQPMLNSKNGSEVKIPPWLEDVSAIGNQPSALVIGPTADTLVKHVMKQKAKKGIPKNRVGANFKRILRSKVASKWLPSFQGSWKKGCRKHSRNQFRRNLHKGSS